MTAQPPAAPTNSPNHSTVKEPGTAGGGGQRLPLILSMVDMNRAQAQG